jgi:hypothetical protein
LHLALQMTTFEDRTRVLAQYRIAQSMARMLGPFIGCGARDAA